jgi:hypothetical protein
VRFAERLRRLEALEAQAHADGPSRWLWVYINMTAADFAAVFEDEPPSDDERAAVWERYGLESLRETDRIAWYISVESQWQGANPIGGPAKIYKASIARIGTLWEGVQHWVSVTDWRTSPPRLEEWRIPMDDEEETP